MLKKRKMIISINVLLVLLIIAACAEFPEPCPDFIRYEAEEGTFGGGAIIHQDTYDCIANMHEPGAWSEVQEVYGCTGGIFTLEISYASAETVVDQIEKSLVVNNQYIQIIVFPKTGTWGIPFSNIDVEVNLNPGYTNTIRLENIIANGNSGGCNIDSYTIYYNQ